MTGYDVLVLGEPMVERHRDAAGRPSAPDAVSGDAFNAACAAALAGARVAVLTALGRDAGGELIIEALASRGVDAAHVVRDDAPTGAYTISPDAAGHPSFSYQRAGSAAGRLGPDALDHWADLIAATPVLVTGGITAALSPGSAELALAAVRHAAAAGRAVCWDTNFRPRLTDAVSARRMLDAVAPYCRLVKIASPGDSGPLLGVVDPDAVRAALRARTRAAVLVTRGLEPVVLDDSGHDRAREGTHDRARDGTHDGTHDWGAVTRHPALTVPDAVDATGAGDVLLGTLAAGLARGESPTAAVPFAVAAAGLSTREHGGAPRADLAEITAAMSDTAMSDTVMSDAGRSDTAVPGPPEPAPAARAPSPAASDRAGSPQGGSRRGSLTAGDFVAVALEVTRRDGLDEVSLRRIATELGTSHMAIYKHHADKDALIEAMIDTVMGSIVTPELVPGAWAGWIEQVALEIVTTLDRYPGLADELLGRIPNRLTPGGVALTERCLDALVAAGLDREQAGTVFLTMFAYIMGSVQLRVRSIRPATRADPRADPLPDTIHQRFDDERFLVGLRLLLTGIRTNT